MQLLTCCFRPSCCKTPKESDSSRTNSTSVAKHNGRTVQKEDSCDKPKLQESAPYDEPKLQESAPYDEHFNSETEAVHKESPVTADEALRDLENSSNRLTPRPEYKKHTPASMLLAPSQHLPVVESEHLPPSRQSEELLLRQSKIIHQADCLISQQISNTANNAAQHMKKTEKLRNMLIVALGPFDNFEKLINSRNAEKIIASFIRGVHLVGLDDIQEMFSLTQKHRVFLLFNMPGVENYIRSSHGPMYEDDKIFPDDAAYLFLLCCGSTRNFDSLIRTKSYDSLCNIASCYKQNHEFFQRKRKCYPKIQFADFFYMKSDHEIKALYENQYDLVIQFQKWLTTQPKKRAESLRLPKPSTQNDQSKNDQGRSSQSSFTGKRGALQYRSMHQSTCVPSQSKNQQQEKEKEKEKEKVETTSQVFIRGSAARTTVHIESHNRPGRSQIVYRSFRLPAQNSEGTYV